MSFFSWLRGLFGPKKVVRKITRLELQPEQAIDAKQEIVDTSGGPLHEHSRRRAIRDARLLPKPKPVLSPRSWALPKKPKKRYFTTEEATRLFAGTLRTRNRNIRDLATDTEQLKRYGLPLWNSETDVAKALELSVRELHFFATHREATRRTHYVTFAIRKRSGGERLIMAPKQKLKALQRQLVEQLVSKLPTSANAHGFIAGRSIRTGAEPHIGRRFVIHLDIADFFPSVTYARVRGLLIGYGYSYPVATTLSVLMTEAERQPVEVDGVIYQVPVGRRHCVQGAPTSPAICNAIATKLDRRLAGLAARHGYVYTRYADDLTFSGDEKEAVSIIIGRAKKIVKDEGFVLNEAKTRVMPRGTSQRVTNVVVNSTIGLSRQERRRIRAAIHQAKKRRPSARTLQQMEGKVAFVSMLNREQAEPLAAALAALPRPEIKLPTITPGTTRHFEFIGGGSKKFWEITVRGSQHTVHFGRIGTAGQSKTKQFDDAASATEDAAKLIREKLQKGYEEK